MALDSKNNIKSVFILPAVGTAVATGTVVTPGSLPTKDSVVITNMSNQVLAPTATGTLALLDPAFFDKIKIVKDRGADLPLQQVVLTRSQVIAASSVAGKLASEQVSYIGYDGSNTNTIQVASNNFYSVKLEHTPNSFAYGKRPANYKYGTFQSPDFGTGTIQNGPNAALIANGLVASLIQNFRPNRTTDWRVFSETVTNATRTAVSGAGTLTFTKYSKVVTASAATASGTFAVGDYIQSAAGTTNGVYKITDIATSGNLTLDVPYQGNNVTITPGTTSIRITSANAGGVFNWGIKITGVKQKYDVNRWRQYDKVRFNVFLDGFPNTTSPTTTSTTAAFDGIAVYEQVANDEYISWGDEGQVFVDQVPPLFREQDAVVGTQYSPAVVSWLDKLPSLIGAGENKGQAILYFVGGSGSANYPAAAGTQLNLIRTFNLWSNVDLPETFPFS
jgi:hypothetical protein